MSNDKDKSSKPRGFAGINSLVSAVDTDMTSSESSVAAQSSSKRKASPSVATVSQPQSNPSKKKSSSPHISKGKSLKISNIAWALIIIVVVALIGWEHYLPNEVQSKSSTNYPKKSSGITAPIPRETRTTTNELYESQPVIGESTLFSRSQIQYCLAEDIRLGSIRSHLDNSQNGEIRWFNSLIGDYNARCARFRYSVGDLEISKKNVNDFRNQLELEGLNRLLGFRR